MKIIKYTLTSLISFAIIFSIAFYASQYLQEKRLNEPSPLLNSNSCFCEKGDCNTGYGILNCKYRNEKYIGHFYHYKFNGEGKYIYSDGSYYDGNWKNGKYHGQGIYKTNAGSTFSCNYNNGLMHGKCTYDYNNGTREFGVCKNNKNEGNWIEISPHGDILYLYYKNGIIIGNVTKNYSNNSKYIGQWSNDSENGKGTYITQNGSKYIGIWKDGFIVYGKYYFKDGRIYSGSFKDMKGHGLGVMKYKDGKIEKGYWEKGILIK